MLKDDILLLAERIVRDRPNTLQVRLMLEEAERKAECDRVQTYTEQRVRGLDKKLAYSEMQLASYAEEAAQGADSCQRCRLIVARFGVPLGVYR